MSEEPEPEQYEQVYTGEEEAIAPAPVETDIAPVPNDDEICIAILQKYSDMHSILKEKCSK